MASRCDLTLNTSPDYVAGHNATSEKCKKSAYNQIAISKKKVDKVTRKPIAPRPATTFLHKFL